MLLGGNHHPEWVTTSPIEFLDDLKLDPPIGQQPWSKGPLIIENDVWVGWRALLVSGITIGNGAVVAARAVVTKDVPPYAIGGNPAKIIRYRFDEPTIDGLLRIAWWEWPHDKVVAHIRQVMSPDVAAFVARHDPAADREPCPDC